MIIDSPIFSGSYAATGSLNQIGNVTITGSLTVTGTINASITGSITTASYALSAELLDGLDSTSFVFTSSFNTVSSSFSTRVTNLENFSSSLDATFATDAELAAVSQSFSSSLSTVSGSLSSRVTNNEVTGSNLTTASGSFSTRTTNLELASGSFSTRVTDLETASGSFSTRVTTTENNITNLQNASSSFSTRVTSAENSIVSIQGATGSYATTGSNNFVGTQYISATNNAIGFTTTASLYTDGGIRVAKDMYVSGNAYFNNVTIYGTQSVQYITSSQLNISTNLISVNTDTPTIRFGGLAVYDSGSTGLSGSLLWDSEQNHWVYSNPSGSTYSGGMLISGPRASSLGTEQGTTACALMMGQGGDHITSSGIFHYGNATCIPNTLVGSTICTTMANASCIGVGITTPSAPLHVGQNGSAAQLWLQRTDGYNPVKLIGGTLADGNGFKITMNTTDAFSITSTGISCFACQVCAPSFLSSGTICATGNTCIGGMGIISSCLGIGTATPSSALQVFKTAYTGNQFKTYAELSAAPTTLSYTTSDGFGLILNMYEAVAGNPYTRYADIVANTGDVSDSAMRFFTKFYNCSAAERMRITSAGNIVVGATSLTATNGANLEVANSTVARLLVTQTGTRSFSLSAESNGFYLFDQTASGTRMFINGSGAACFACELTAKTLGTNDLILNNLNYECANYVDGTRGSWLIQEGACDLFIINQVSCKKYKFNLIEIE